MRIFRFYRCLFLVSLVYPFLIFSQTSDSNLISSLNDKITTLESAELVQSMSLRSLITPFYLSDIKALTAKQAFDFWKQNNTKKYVSHLNVYSALYYANKYLNYDSVFQIAYNEKHGHDESVTAIRYLNKNPHIFYSAGTDGRVIRWDMKNMDGFQEVIFKENALIESIDINSSDDLLMIQTKNQGIIIKTIESLTDFDPVDIRDTEPVQASLFLPNENKYLIANKKGVLKIKAYMYEKTVGNTSNQINTMLIKDDGTTIFTGTKEGAFEVWEDSISKEFFYDEMYGINAMAMSSNQKLLLLGREKGDAILWDLEKMQLRRIISGHESAITDVDFSPDNTKMLTASRDKTVRIWDVTDSKKLPLILDDHDDWVLTAKFDPTGSSVITGARDQKIRIWPLDPQVLADRLCQFVSRNMTNQEWLDYVGSSQPYRKTCPNLN